MTTTVVVVAPPAGAVTPAQQSYAQALLDRLPLELQVGQVLMAGSSAAGADGATVAAIRNQHVGSVILTGRSTAGVGATASVSAALERANPEAAKLFVATDQEGGQVQVLRGPGFDNIPAALSQGRQSPGALRGGAHQWGSQLRQAGVNVNLAPVLGTVPSPVAARSNSPIGVFDREFGYDPAVVAAHGTAFAQGMADAGVNATMKHFPGLGRVTGNTDVTAGVTDTVTTRHDPYLQPFAAAVRAGAPMLMMSSAVYSRIDANNPAVFSPTIIGGMVRGDLGFTGVIVSDDLGDAKQVAFLAPGERAVRFIAAGGDLVLDVNPASIPAMYDAVLARARVDAGFRARVRDAALHVLAAKSARGLLPGPRNGRIGGADRYATAAQVAEQLGRNGRDVTNFVVASGEPGSGGVDALSANYLAGVLASRSGGPVPVLLTRQGALPAATTQAVRTLLGARTNPGAPVGFFVVGGAAAVSQAVAEQLGALGGPVTRVGGADRYATAASAATQLGEPAVGAYVARFGQQPANTAFLSNGLSPADAVSAGPIAYRNHFPVLLTQPGTLSPATMNALRQDQVRNVILLGGTAAVSDTVLTQLRGLGLTVTREAGPDRYATNAAVYGFAAVPTRGTKDNPVGGLGYPKPVTGVLADGLSFADALTAGPLAAEGSPQDRGRAAIEANSPLLLTSPARLSTPTRTYLSDNKASITKVVGVGLTASVPDSVLAEADLVAR